MEASKPVVFASKILSYALVDGASLNEPIEKPSAALHEELDRPSVLPGKIYKIKPPTATHAVYVIIGDISLDGELHPWEIFIQTKNPEHRMMTDTVTRLVSALFRKGGKIDFIAEEFKDIYDSNGGYRQRGGKWYNSIMHEIGEVIENHIKGAEPSPDTAYLVKNKTMECPECKSLNTTLLDGCLTCLDCGSSKCG